MPNDSITRKVAKDAMAIKRAAIYIRVSSEKQANKISPLAQEEDCRTYCEERGYVVIGVYRDTEKYRVGKKLVEPAGTRSDRPGLRQMLADAAVHKFDVIVAWREDRLYRGMRPMLDVIDCIEANKIEIELVKETFDSKMAPVKAWVAKMELDAKSDRMLMGVAGRLAEGKVWNNNLPYGYCRVDDRGATEPEESKWVQKIWGWFADGSSLRTIRLRLIENGAPQRVATKIAWSISVISEMLGNDTYHTGILKMHWDGELYLIPVPVLVDADTAARVAERREKNKAHPAHNIKYEYLASGITYCKACGWKMRAVTYTKYAGGKIRKTPAAAYKCSKHMAGHSLPGCPHGIPQRAHESQLWEKVWSFIADDKQFEEMISARIKQLKDEELDVNSKVERLQRELGNLALERQRTITWARKGTITEADLDLQLGALSYQETELKRELADMSLLIGNRAERLTEFANKYRQKLRTGMEWLNEEPRTPEEAREQRKCKQEIIDAIVKRVYVMSDKTVKVEFDFDCSQGQLDDSVNKPDLSSEGTSLPDRSTSSATVQAEPAPIRWRE